MGIPVLIIGKSGSGKSFSMMKFAENEVGLINVLGKKLPFQTDIKSVDCDDYATIKAILKEAKVNKIVIDDAGYLMTNQFMRGHSKGKAGSSVFDLYNQIGDDFWELIRYISLRLPENRIVYLMMHEDKNDFGDIKPKTIGKMLDNQVCVEGMFTIVLRAIVSDGKHLFRTVTDGSDVTKTPAGMFEQETTCNDLKFVDNIIRKYYKLEE